MPRAPASVRHITTHPLPFCVVAVTVLFAAMCVAAAASFASIATTMAVRRALSAPPTMVVAYRSSLAAYTRTVTGRLPDAVTQVPPRPGTPHGALLLDAAVTTATASRFGLHVGSRVNIGSYLPARPVVLLRVTAIVAPRRPGSTFWQADPTLATPIIPVPNAVNPWWQGTALVGPDELSDLQSAYGGGTIHGQWFTPLARGGLNRVQLTPVLAHLRGLLATNGGRALQEPLPNFTGYVGTSRALTISTGFTGAIDGFVTQQRAAAALDALLIADVLLAGLLVVVTCARLAASAYGPELALPGGTNGAAWALGGAAALATIGIPALAAVWTHRGIRAATGGSAGHGRADLATARPSRRRLVAELTVLLIAGAALAAARLHGIGPGADPLTWVAPVLAAAAAGLITARLYPVPVRGLLRLAAGRPGVVGFVALARAARATIGALLPALTLVISLTLAAFGVMIVGSVRASQDTAAWRQVGADVTVQATANSTVPAAFARAVAAAPGVQHVAAVYAAPGRRLQDAALGATLGATLRAGGGPPRPVGLVVVPPASYAALAPDTPWPGSPTGALARGSGEGGTAVPVLTSAGLNAGAGRGTLVLDGTRLPVRIAGTSGPTPAMPPGEFVVLPAWAYPRLPSVRGPDELLATGTGISLAAVRRAVAHVLPGAAIRSRARVRTRTGPADRPSDGPGHRLAAGRGRGGE